MSTEKKVWIHDVEQLPNFHCATFLDRDEPQRVKTFIIYGSRNDAREYYDFLRNEVSGLIGFNSVNFDYPLIHFFMSFMEGYGLVSNPSSDEINAVLYDEMMRIINAEYSAIPEYKVRIPQLDLYRIHHFDNKNKTTSLKAVEIAIKFENVQDMPFEHDHVVQPDEVHMLVGYNYNDVQATYQFYLLTKDMIEMRKKLGNKYGINLRNANDPKIGQEIFGRQIALKKGFNYSDIKDMRTYRHEINLSDCILPYVHFKSREFTALLDSFKGTTITSTHKAFEKSVIYKGLMYDYGVGGIHACAESGIYESDEIHTIVDIDVKSYYPNLAIQNGFYPMHLGYDFVQVYKELFEQRLQAQKEDDKATNSGLKLALNGTFGKSNDKFSLFFDPKYFVSITINGQLLLTMLCEDIVDRIPSAEILQVNTDGVTVRLPRTNKHILDEICEVWQKKTKLILEFQEYTKMVIRDVNNYMAVSTDGKPKYKGAFEIIPMQNGAVAYNKDWSMRVVPKALDAYYRFGTPIEEFIRNHRDIYDFCIGFRARAGWDLYRVYVKDGGKYREKLQRTIRYYNSVKGDSIIKVQNGKKFEDPEDEVQPKIVQLESGRASTLFNRYVKKDWEKYDIDYNYYIAEANKIVNAVYDGQLKLF